MDNLVVNHPRKARVYFSPTENTYLWKTLFLNPDYAHCFVVIEGVLINPSWHFVDICKAEDLYECTTYVDIEFSPPPEKKRFPLQFVTCVTLVKEIIGVKCWHIIHPEGLYKYLVRHHDKFKTTQATTSATASTPTVCPGESVSSS